MSTGIALSFLVISSQTVLAQKTEVLNAFSKHGIDAGILNPENLQKPDNFAFDMKQSITTAGKTSTTLAKFDPSNAKEEQWTVISIDGKTPSKGDINTFRKNQAKPENSTQTDDTSFKIESESSDYLVVSYKLNSASIPKDASFMKDCKFYTTINLKTKKLEQVQTLNEKPVKIKILNADKFDLVIKYSWNNQAKRYFSQNEDVNILAKFIGQPVNVKTVTEYSNYIQK